MPEREIWRDVPDFDGRYRVSTYGRVLSLCFYGGKRSRILAGTRRKEDGYRQFALCAFGRQVRRKLHQIVMLVFVGKCPDGQEVRHIDGDPGNNHLSNLSYGTRTENERDKVKHGTSNRGERSGRAKLTEVDVKQIRRNARAGMSHVVQAQTYGVSRDCIRGAVHRRTWAHVL